MSVSKVTLDTNVLQEYWKQRVNRDVVKELLSLAREGTIELGVTRRIEDDIPRPPLSAELAKLPALGVKTTPGMFRLNVSRLGQDMWGDEEFAQFESTGNDLAVKRGRKPPDWRDWDHLHAHYALGRDAFLTWDKGILCLASELKARFQMVVMKPEDFLTRLGHGGTCAS